MKREIRRLFGLSVLLALLVTGCKLTNSPVDNEFAPIREVVVPDNFQIVPGQKLYISGRGFSVIDQVVFRPESGGNDFTAGGYEATAFDIKVTLKSNIPAGNYRVVVFRRDGQEVELGAITVRNTIALDGLTGDPETSVGGGVVLLTNAAGNSQFAPSDSIMMVDKATGIVTKVLGNYDPNAPQRLSFATPADFQGELRVYLIRGATATYLQDVKTIDLKLFDYYKGGVVIWFDPNKALSGVVVNLYNGLTNQRKGDSAKCRGLMGTKYNSGDNNGTGTTERQGFGMGDINTQAFLDFEISKGRDGTGITGTNSDLQTCFALRIKGWTKNGGDTGLGEYTVIDLDDGLPYGDWYVPSRLETECLIANMDRLNRICDSLGGDPMPGAAYKYAFGPDAGQNAMYYNDGAAFATSNSSLTDPTKVQFCRFARVSDPTQGAVWSQHEVNLSDYVFRLCRKF
ncbi:hypothetical protein FACS1894159_00580 [Bacteroidia bacterium]|nr:hypothetical protein FACS1894159_00580 [Bacteroidia bacterium]